MCFCPWDLYVFFTTTTMEPSASNISSALDLGHCVLIPGFLDAYTISAVGQDEFEDVKVPDTPIRNPQGFDQEFKK